VEVARWVAGEVVMVAAETSPPEALAAAVEALRAAATDTAKEEVRSVAALVAHSEPEERGVALQVALLEEAREVEKEVAVMEVARVEGVMGLR
jgi:hypothetical protein